MKAFAWSAALAVVAHLGCVRAAPAQNQPHVGYVYPAGGRQGANFEVTVGGQLLDGVSQAHVSGGGVSVTVLSHYKPLTPAEVNKLRQKAREVQERMRAERAKPFSERRTFAEVAKEFGLSSSDLEKLAELKALQADTKRQPNPAIAETVRLQVKLQQHAEPGERELRLVATQGMSNPIKFHVGTIPELSEQEPNDGAAGAAVESALPLTLNGQILPGDVDRFRLDARQGAHLVVSALARDLIPYLADAVPGWFQATMALYDADGKEVAYADDFRFHPDPVLHYEIPRDGPYVLEIRDAIYRGREDFVYRITAGELPFVTSIFPLGGPVGDSAPVGLLGWNLPADRWSLDIVAKTGGIHTVPVLDDPRMLNRVAFAVGTLREELEAEPNNDQATAQAVRPPLTINGRIDKSGDWDVYRFEGVAGGEVVLEVQARRLNSPVDSLVKLTDAKGQLVAVNDDFEDKGSGLTTHQADSQVCVTLPATGTYFVHVGDTQEQGGVSHAYRLRIGARQPDFELRVTPSSINARPGSTVPINVHALRREGFADDIAIALKDAPRGFKLSGGWIPAGCDTSRATLTIPATATDGAVSLNLEGTASIRGQTIHRPAAPADDMMQAFAYHHLVTAGEFIVAVSGTSRANASVELLETKPVKIRPGGTARVRFSAPAAANVAQLKFVPSGPPDGLSVEEVIPVGEDLAIILRADADKAKPGWKGNVIFEAFANRPMGRKLFGFAKAANRQVPLGILPAVPLEIIEPAK